MISDYLFRPRDYKSIELYKNITEQEWLDPIWQLKNTPPMRHAKATLEDAWHLTINGTQKIQGQNYANIISLKTLWS